MSETQKTKTTTVVKYKAHCGVIYSAADPKMYHYICPTDNKKLAKSVVRNTG